jgi:DNA-binding transcriptional ArsR family regulator
MNSHTIQFSAQQESQEPAKLDTLALKKAALVLRAVNHKLRQQILKTIDSAGKITVTELYGKLMLDQSSTSQHLSLLRRAGFVKTTRVGKRIYYAISTKRFAGLNKFIESLLAAS